MNLGLLSKNPASGYACGGGGGGGGGKGGGRVSGLNFSSAWSRCLLYTERCAKQTNKILSFIT